MNLNLLRQCLFADAGLADDGRVAAGWWEEEEARPRRVPAEALFNTRATQETKAAKGGRGGGQKRRTLTRMIFFSLHDVLTIPG